MKSVTGLHHVTAISGPAQQNLDFYAGVLGMRLVKKSVNQDDPGTYHFFYADAEGSPGTDLTFFPWAQLAPAREGVGLSTEAALAVPLNSLGFWQERLGHYGISTAPLELRFGEKALPFRDPHGLRVALVETSDPRELRTWEKSPVDPKFQVRGLHGARMWQRSLEPTVDFLAKALGFSYAGHEAGWSRYTVAGGGSGKFVEIKEMPNMPVGRWGTGSIHHLAWRVDDTPHEMEVRQQILHAGIPTTAQIDRFWFKSVYFNEPGGAVFELATDGPGFAVDEDPSKLGESLVLPPWLEPQRAQIEAALPPLTLPHPNPE